MATGLCGHSSARLSWRRPDAADRRHPPRRQKRALPRPALPAQPASAKSAITADEAVRPTPAAPRPKAMSAKAVLEAMRNAYKRADSYSDQAAIRVRTAKGDKQSDDQINCFVGYVKPNKIRVQYLGHTMVCDGKQLVGFVNELPAQVIKRDAPETITLKTILADPLFADRWARPRLSRRRTAKGNARVLLGAGATSSPAERGSAQDDPASKHDRR